jgi:phosphatidylserine synthase
LAPRLTPNLITAISLGVGVAAGVLIFPGRPIAWVAAAVLLQLALIIDCMDGEVARFTRRYSAFGGWLDGIGDRIKEYLVFAAVAAVAVRDHHSYGWLLAIIALVVVTARHLEDYAYTDRQAADRRAEPALVLITRSDDGSAEGTRTALPDAPGRTARIAFWAKKIAHVPIAERYLVLSVMLLTMRPVWVLVAAVAVSGFALLWVLGGRLLRALRQHRSYPTPTLDQQLDLGLLGLLTGRVRFPFLPGVVVLIILWLGLIASICYDAPMIAWAWAVASVVVAGCTLQPPVTDRFGWLALPLVWIAEGAVISSLLAHRIDGALIFVTLAAIAYRRYELIYSVRLRGLLGPRALLGVDGRILTVGVLFTVAALIGNQDVIIWGLVAVAVETLGEAVLGTAIRWRRPVRARQDREHPHSEAGSQTP